MPATPSSTSDKPTWTMRRPSTRWLSRAWTQLPAVQDRVEPVTATPARARLWWRTVTMVRVTKASAPK